jgi:peptide/nickel transport system substrate-binding protein
VIEERRFPGRQGRLLFAYLVAEQGRPVPRDELAEALWETPPPTWEKVLTVIVSKLRSLLTKHGIDGAGSLTGAFGCYRLTLPVGTWVDVIAATTAAREAEEALSVDDLDQAKRAAALAASLVCQPFLPGEDGTWVEGKRRELAEVHRRALTVLADANLRVGDAPEAARWAEQAIALEPFRETGYRRLMEAHVAAGNRAEALQVYEQCRRLLAEELGAYPSPETESIYRALLDAPLVEKDGRPPASSAADIEREPARSSTRRAGSRTKVAAAAVAIVVGAGAVAAVLATRGGPTPATTIAPNAVGLIDWRSGRVRDQVQVGQGPAAVAVGGGAVWVASETAGTISRIDPSSNSVQTITAGSGASGIVVCRGGVWVTNHDGGTVSWVSPETDAIVRVIHTGAGPTAVACGFGSVWVTNADDRTVTRINANSGDVTANAIATNAVGAGITVGGGAVWVTDEATHNVYGIDPGTNTVTETATVGAGPTGIAYGNGSLWVANSLDNTVSKVDATTVQETAKIPVSGGPSSVAFSDGAVWVSSEFGSRVVRIDPRRDIEVGSTRIGNRPEGLASGAGGTWVTAQASGNGHRGGRLIVLGGGLDSIDPAVADNTNSSALIGLAYDGLTAGRRVGGAAGTQIVPDLAAALPAPTEGDRTYTFHLRRGIRYSDGRLLRAADFRRALVRMLAIGGPGASSFLDLAGARACLHHKHCDLSSSVIVHGPSTLTFRLSAPDPRFTYHLAWLFPVPQGTPFRAADTKPVPSTGAYAFERYVPNRLLTLVRNRFFHVWFAAARPDGYPDEIDYRILGNNQLAVRDVMGGKADVAFEAGLSGAQIQQLRVHHANQIHLDPQAATTYVFLNVRRPPFNDVRVRRALAYAVDRQRIAAFHGAGLLAQPTCQLVPPTVPGYRPYCPYTIAPDASGEWKAPDLARARSLIRESGTRGERVVVWSFAYFHPESEYLVSLLQRLGYRAQLHYIPNIGAYFNALSRTPTAQAGFEGWFGEQLAVDWLNLFACSDIQNNPAHFCDPHIDTQIARLTKSEPANPAGTRALAAAIDRELTDRAPFVPLFTPSLPDLTSARVGNYEYDNGNVLLDQLWVR